MDFPKSVPNVGLVDGKFVDENPSTGQIGSLIPADWGNSVTEEILSVIDAAGITPLESDHSQLERAVNALISRAIPEAPKQSTETIAGVNKIAALEDVESGTDKVKSVSSWGVFKAIAKVVTQATESAFGWAKIASQEVVDAGQDHKSFVTARTLAAKPLSGVPAASRLLLTTTGASAFVSITAAQVALLNSTGGIAVVSGVAASASVSAAGLGGIDTGVVAASTWYNVWLIWNGENLGAILSLSSTAPLMPVGYTHRLRVGTIRTDATANKYPLAIIKAGSRVRYTPKPGGNTVAWPVMSSGSTIGNVSAAGALVAVSTTGVVPPSASLIVMNTSTLSSAITVLLCPSNNFGIDGSATNPPLGIDIATPGQQPPFHLLLESSNVYFAANASYVLSCLGWEEDL
ncbi:hypothetical protein AUC61_23865 [Pseudomonas sp. S25]|uniref:Phage tail fibre repeat-containing protein n=1 Tax=Pseudomonas maioricensis TaxID=1766623 RepID=A0ABS9ZQK1_9PSED|nr:hypothetical protein [Pseudomonas sp. S25]MCI8212572.1 hypothetical protein [Pseudomonas sp. S25]